MSVTQQIRWIQLKHLLLRHMYNLSLPKLCATLLVDPVLANARKRVCSVQMHPHCTVWCLI